MRPTALASLMLARPDTSEDIRDQAEVRRDLRRVFRVMRCLVAEVAHHDAQHHRDADVARQLLCIHDQNGNRDLSRSPGQGRPGGAGFPLGRDVNAAKLTGSCQGGDGSLMPEWAGAKARSAIAAHRKKNRPRPGR
ncbi:hypothetical protein G6F59_015217 [Rhizopus arrhizus]|nr:hypothetical protein G6F59_015217 [Rhizopus arrhizus]